MPDGIAVRYFRSMISVHDSILPMETTSTVSALDGIYADGFCTRLYLRSGSPTRCVKAKVDAHRAVRRVGQNAVPHGDKRYPDDAVAVANDGQLPPQLGRYPRLAEEILKTSVHSAYKYTVARLSHPRG